MLLKFIIFSIVIILVLVATFILGVWYGRRYRDKISKQITQVHETVKDVRLHVRALSILLKH